jgi:molybdopterin converting factor small subunit
VNGIVIHIQLPPALREHADGRDAIDVAGRTVTDALGDLVAQHPALRRHLYDDHGELRGYVNVFLNDDEVRALARGTMTTIAQGDTIMIVPSIAGG